MSTATLANAPASRWSAASILRVGLVVVAAIAIALGAFVVGRVTKPAAHVPAATVHTISSTRQAPAAPTCLIRHGSC
jgi:hypothetical protein